MNTKKYFALSVASALSAAAMTVGFAASAQAVTPLSCSAPSAAVNVNQSVLVTASGGSGTYAWSGDNLSVTNGTGSQLSVAYPTAGTYTIRVSSNGQSASCQVTVTGTASATPLSCAPATQNVTLGQTASVSASGGNGSYSWSAPDLSITNATGAGFSANYGSAGTHVLTVSSGGQTSSCAINVIASSSGGGSTPSFPNTGGGYGRE